MDKEQQVMSSSSSSSSSPQVSRSHSYPDPVPWHPMDSTRKGSLDANPPPISSPDSPAPFSDSKSPSLHNDNGRNANGGADVVSARAANKTYPGKNMEDKKKMWRTSGSAVQQKLVGWKAEDPLDLSHLNLESIPKPLFKGDYFLAIKHLNLSSNRLSSLPPQIALLRSLVTLDCTFNRITDLPTELGDLLSLEYLHLSGNPLNKDLMQRHLLGTASVLQHLKERQAAEQGRVRKSNKFKGLKSTSDPDSKPRDDMRATLTPPLPAYHTLPTSSPSTLSPAISPRNPLSASDNTMNLSNKDKKAPPLTRQRSGPPPQPQNVPSPTLPATPSPTTPPPTSQPTPPDPDTPPPVIEPRGDMGPIVAQLKFGIIYTETIKSLAASSPKHQQKNEDYMHTFNGAGTLITSSTHGTKEKFILRDGEGRFTFNTYCTASFAELRDSSGVPQDRYLAALESISALGFAGKSGSVLLKSADGLLVLKTISKDEAKFLRKIMPQFLAYFKANPKTYLTRFWGLYKVIRSPIEKVNFVVMKNAFFTSKKIHERYDLKGSTVGRATDEENVRRSRIVLKDLNFNRQLKLGPERGKVFLAQLEKDTDFLQKFDIIDYSLIVGVHYLADAPTKDPAKEYPIEGEIQAMDKETQLIDEIYFINIIDMLQPYNIRKTLEYGIKSIRYGNGISVIPPENYAARFLNFIQSVVE
eukprot:Phypoly_transcript_03310.p1 GENE.Phypoly_transcript_03310~~Phypoly_transcript_03310.p1  ORF type:complete len:697 (+),score=142.42 Phypoly_transcript_03310:316-2406(+)